MPDVVTITGHHRFAKTMRAIKVVRAHSGWTLHPAKKAMDAARADERVDIPVPSKESRDTLMSELSELGWATESDTISIEAKTPDPPDWWLRVKGLVRVVEHLPRDDNSVRLRLALRDCTIEPGDAVGWVMHEDFVLSIGVDPETLSGSDPVAVAGPEDLEDIEEDADFIRQLFPVGIDLEVLAPNRLNWRDDWRLVREKLWNAVSHLATELVDNPEGGSLHRYREYLDHNELGLAYDELLGLAEVNPTSDGFHEAMREAALLMHSGGTRR